MKSRFVCVDARSETLLLACRCPRQWLHIVRCCVAAVGCCGDDNDSYHGDEADDDEGGDKQLFKSRSLVAPTSAVRLHTHTHTYHA
jgi:hypothetical protein